MKKLLQCTEDATIQFNKDNTGTIRLGLNDSPDDKPINFVTRPFTSNLDDSTRAYLYSRRDTTARYVGPITADIELDSPFVDPMVSQRMKRRTQDDRNNKGRTLIQLDHDVAPPTNPSPAKRPRRAVKPEKRPRPATRPRDGPNPLKPRDSFPSSGLTSSLGASRLASTPPIRPTAPGSTFGARNGAAVSPVLPSPVVSPGRLGSGKVGARLGDGRRGTLTTSALASGLGGRKMSPMKVDGSKGGVVKPSLRSMTAGRSGLSPLGSKVVPKGGSPGMGALGANGNRPESPRLGGLRARNQDTGGLRRTVIHVLALGAGSMQAVRSRALGNRLSMELKDRFMEVLKEVGTDVMGLYTLKRALWDEVSAEYEGYSEAERARVRVERSNVAGGKVNGAAEVRGMEGMSDASLDAGIREFEADRSEVGVVSCEADELRLRKKFKTWFPLYDGVIEELEGMGDTFRGMERRYREARSSWERESLVRRIASKYERHKKRRDELTRLLPRLHARLREIRDALEEWAKPARVPGRRE